MSFILLLFIAIYHYCMRNYYVIVSIGSDYSVREFFGADYVIAFLTIAVFFNDPWYVATLVWFGLTGLFFVLNYLLFKRKMHNVSRGTI